LYSQIRKNKSFSLQQKKGIQYSIITEDVGWKRNHSMQNNYQN